MQTKDDDYTRLERAIREAIEQDGGSIYSIAARAGIHRRTIQRWLAGERAISLHLIGRVADVLGVEIRAPKKIQKKQDKGIDRP